MAHEVLTPEEMARADRLAIAAGPLDGYGLMLRAGTAVAHEILLRFADAPRISVLCGPGNNGGDGYVVASLLREASVPVDLYALGPPRSGSDAAIAARAWDGLIEPLASFRPTKGEVVVDALFGAGFSRELDGDAAAAVQACRAAGARVVAIDVPSGVDGTTGEAGDDAFTATLTVTFVRPKPGHLLQPGRRFCGEVVVADIGIGDDVIREVGSRLNSNAPSLWLADFPVPVDDTHKYRRGHVAVFSGGIAATGAARLSALASARAGAGAVTMLSPPDAIAVNAAHLTSVILRKAGSMEDVDAFLADREPSAMVFGPGLDSKPKVGQFLVDLVGRLDASTTVVVDASALTSLASEPQPLFDAMRRPNGARLVLTPHDGEFARLFPDLASVSSKVERARAAAARARCVVILKGPDTVIADPDCRAAINVNGTPLLATAGSGDVLSGIVAGLAAQRMPPFEAACAAVWLHAAAATDFGPGLIAEDLPQALLPVLRRLHAMRGGDTGR